MPEEKHPEFAHQLLTAMLARSEALWGKERTEELRPQIEALTDRLVELAKELPQNEEDPGDTI